MKRKAILFLLCCAGLCAAEIRIDPSHAVISAENASGEAAKELKTHLDLMTGKNIPILSGRQIPEGAYVFYVGRAPASAAGTFKPEEARWKITQNAAYFYGDRNNGAQNAVYDFLENELGVRWPGGKEIACRKQNPILVKNTEGCWIPELKIRCIRGANGKGDMRIWQKRMRHGRHDQPKYGHAFLDYWKRFGKTHPEYFAMRKDGIRGPVSLPGGASTNVAAYNGKAEAAVAMCVTSEALIRQIMADWDKKSEYINLCENDALGEDSCHCPACTALDVVPKENLNWKNYFADRYIHFAKRVLEEARKYRKDVKVCMYAYNATEEAPKREKLTENIVMGIIPTIFTKRNIEHYVGSWKKAGLHTFFYRPNRHHYYSLPQLPCGYEKHFFEIWQYLYRNGAIGFDYDSSKTGSLPQWFSDYVLYKAMQDPSKPFEHWEKQYMEAYGAAAGEIREYYRYWREKVWDARLCPDQAELTEKGKFFNFARGLVWNLGKYYKTEDFDNTDKILEKALARKLSPDDRKRVNALKTFHEHARLFFNAVTRKTDADTIALLEFRKRNGIEPLQTNEQYWGDICGVKRVMNFKDFTPPYIQTPLFWSFRLDQENRGIREKWQEENCGMITAWKEKMPTNSPWETPYAHYSFPSPKMRRQTGNYDGIAWYAVALHIPEEWKNREIYLYFGAVDESCWVYLNGKEAGKHLYEKPDDWTTPFTIRIDPWIQWTQKAQALVVRVEDKGGAGGIYKRVWLLSKAPGR